MSRMSVRITALLAALVVLLGLAVPVSAGASVQTSTLAAVEAAPASLPQTYLHVFDTNGKAVPVTQGPTRLVAQDVAGPTYDKTGTVRVGIAKYEVGWRFRFGTLTGKYGALRLWETTPTLGCDVARLDADFNWTNPSGSTHLEERHGISADNGLLFYSSGDVDMRMAYYSQHPRINGKFRIGKCHFVGGNTYYFYIDTTRH